MKRVQLRPDEEEEVVEEEEEVAAAVAHGLVRNKGHWRRSGIDISRPINACWPSPPIPPPVHRLSLSSHTSINRERARESESERARERERASERASE